MENSYKLYEIKIVSVVLSEEKGTVIKIYLRFIIQTFSH